MLVSILLTWLGSISTSIGEVVYTWTADCNHAKEPPLVGIIDGVKGGVATSVSSYAIDRTKYVATWCSAWQSAFVGDFKQQYGVSEYYKSDYQSQLTELPDPLSIYSPENSCVGSNLIVGYPSVFIQDNGCFAREWSGLPGVLPLFQCPVIVNLVKDGTKIIDNQIGGFCTPTCVKHTCPGTCNNGQVSTSISVL